MKHAKSLPNVTTFYLLAVFVLIPMAGGCALGDRKIALLYEPVSTGKPTPSQPVAVAPASLDTSASSRPVSVAKFDDLREDKAVVGEVRNGYGMKMAKVLIENQDAGGWVSNALSAELEQNSFRVTKIEKPADASPSSPAISGAIVQLYCKMFMSYDCRVMIKVQVSKAGVVLFAKEYEGKGSGLAVLVTAQEYETVTKQALQDAMKQAVPEILEAIK